MLQEEHFVEMMDVVDENDVVIGTASKEDVYIKNLRHRIVHVLVFNTDGKMLLQLRAPQLTFCPNHWSTAVGGHIQAGETPEQAGIREYREELGTTSKLILLGKDYYVQKDGPSKFLTTFTTTHPGPFDPDPTAVTQASFFTINEIRELIAHDEKFHPELLFLLKKYY